MYRDIIDGICFGVLCAIIAMAVIVVLDKSPGDVLTNAERSTGVFIVSSELRGIGSAFKVGDDKLVTAAHVCQALNNLGSVKVTNKGGSYLVREVHAYDKLNVDVCVLQTVKKTHGYVFGLSKRKANHMEVLVSMGYPRAEYPMSIMNLTVLLQEMLSSSFHFMDIAMASEYFIKTNGGIIPGMSGGPALDEDGNVIGVNARVNMDANQSYFAPIYRVREWIYGI